jgi:hypothetical protein
MHIGDEFVWIGRAGMASRPSMGMDLGMDLGMCLDIADSWPGMGMEKDESRLTRAGTASSPFPYLR